MAVLLITCLFESPICCFNDPLIQVFSLYQALLKTKIREKRNTVLTRV